MSDRPVLTMMVGLPGSGKSKIADELKEKATLNNFDIHLYSTDKWIEDLAEASNHGYNQLFKAEIGKATKHADKCLEEALKHSKSIIWDQTNLTIKSRAKKLAKIPCHYLKVCIFVNTPLDECLLRNSKRPEGRRIAENLIYNMYLSLQTPSKDEGFDAIILQ